MKAISIKQPWASLIVNGIKDIENRTWKCTEKYIGQRVLIHSSAKPDNEPYMIFNDAQCDAIDDCVMDVCEYYKQTGRIIGSVKIIDCVQNHPSVWAEKVNLKIGDIVPYKNTRGNIKKTEIMSFTTVNNGDLWFNGIDTETKAKVWYPTHVSIELRGDKPIYNWVLSDPIIYEKPIENVKGKLGFWDYKGIEEVTIECPECGTIQPAVADHTTVPFSTFIHDCKHCGFVIMEQDWCEVKEEVKQ